MNHDPTHRLLLRYRLSLGVFVVGLVLSGVTAFPLLIAGAFREPMQRAWILRYALVLCAAVIPTAFIAGAVREIPVYWRLIDCSFGVLGAIPLWYCLHCLRKLQDASDRMA